MPKVYTAFNLYFFCFICFFIFIFLGVYVVWSLFHQLSFQQSIIPSPNKIMNFLVFKILLLPHLTPTPPPPPPPNLPHKDLSYNHVFKHLSVPLYYTLIFTDPTLLFLWLKMKSWSISAIPAKFLPLVVNLLMARIISHTDHDPA